MIIVNGIDIGQNVYDAFISLYGQDAFERSVSFYYAESAVNVNCTFTAIVENSSLLEGDSVRNLIDVIKLLTRVTSNNFIVDSDFVWDESILDMIIELEYEVNYDNETEYLIRRIEDLKLRS